MSKESPFFSVVIPTYNPKIYIGRLMKSIATNECIDDVEIIVSDDVSSEPFDDVLEPFSNLNIVRIANKEHTGFPRYGRQHGLEVAKGKWITFADQDDYFLANALDHMKECIIKENMHNFIVSDFIEESVETGKRIRRKGRSGWTHGKFYEKEFMTKYGISYDYVKYCEDINLSTKIDCVCIANHVKSHEYPNQVYVWGRRKDSLSDAEYFKKSMPDYIKATLGVIINFVEQYITDKDLIGLFNAKFIVTLLHVYFYYQSKTLSQSRRDMIISILTVQPIYSKFKWLTGFSNETIFELLNTDLMWLYNQTRHEDYNQIPFIEQITFKDWMNQYLD